MEKYTNESERLRDIAKMFTDTSAVNDFLSEEELDELYDAEQEYNRLEKVSEALNEEPLQYDEGGTPYYSSFPRYDIETGVELGEDNLPVEADPLRSPTVSEQVDFLANQSTFFDELADSPSMFFTGLGHSLHNSYASFFGNVYDASDAGADSITDQVAYQTGVGVGQMGINIGSTYIGAGIGGALGGVGGAKLGATLGTGIGMGLNAWSNREVEKQATISEGIEHGLGSTDAAKLGNTVANKVALLDLLQEGLPLTVYGKGIQKAATKSATSDTVKEAFGVAKDLGKKLSKRGAISNKEIINNIQPYIDAGLLKIDNGAIKLVDKEALNKILVKDTLFKTAKASAGESFIEVLDTLIENTELNKALGYEAKDTWEGAGEAALVAGLASGVSTGATGVMFNNIKPTAGYDTAVKNFERLSKRYQLNEEFANRPNVRYENGDIVITESGEEYTGDKDVKGSVTTNVSTPLKNPVITTNKKDEQSVQNSNDLRATVIKKTTNNTDKQIEFKKDMQGSADDYNFQQGITNQDDSSVDPRTNAVTGKDTVAESVEASKAGIELNNKQNEKLLAEQEKQLRANVNNVQLTEYEQGVVDKLKATHGLKSNIKLLNKLNKESKKRALTFEEVAIRTKLNNILNNKPDVKTTDNTKSNNAHRKLRPYTSSETDSSSNSSTNVGAIKNGTIDFGNRVKQFHYTIRRTLQQSNGKVSLNACKAAAQVLAGKLGVNLRGELDKVGENGVKSEDNVVGVNNAKARIITVKNSTDNITISHELAHSVYDDVLNIVYNGLVRTFNMGNNSTVTNTLSNNASNNGQQNLQQFNEDVRKLYNKVKKHLINTRRANEAPMEYDTSNLSENETTYELFGEIVAAITTNPDSLAEITPEYQYIVDAFTKALDMSEGTFEAYCQYVAMCHAYNEQGPINNAAANQIYDTSEENTNKPAWYLQTYNFFHDFINDADYREDIRKVVKNFFGQFVSNDYTLNKEIDRILGLDGTDPRSREIHENVVQAIRFLQGSSIDAISAFVSGSGLEFNSRAEIHGFINLLSIRDSIRDWGKRNGMTNQESEREIGRYLLALATIGQNLGNEEYVEYVREMSGEDPQMFIATTRALIMLNTVDGSDSLWREFIRGRGRYALNDTLVRLFHHIRESNTDFANYSNEQFVSMMEFMWDRMAHLRSVQQRADIFYQSDRAIDPNKRIGINNSPKDFVLVPEKDNSPVQGSLANSGVIARAIDEIFRKRVETHDTGMSLADALSNYVEVVNDPEKFHVFDQVAKQIYDWERHINNYASEASSTSASKIRAFTQVAGAFHIPLVRSFLAAEKDKYVDDVSDENYNVTSMKGSDRPTNNLFDNLALACRSMIIEAHCNSSLESLASLAGYGIDIENIVFEDRVQQALDAENTRAANDPTYTPRTEEEVREMIASRPLEYNADDYAAEGYGAILQRIIPDMDQVIKDPSQEISKEATIVISSLQNDRSLSEQERNAQIRLVRNIERMSLRLLRDSDMTDYNQINNIIESLRVNPQYSRVNAFKKTADGILLRSKLDIYSDRDISVSKLLQSEGKKFSIINRNGEKITFQVMDPKFLQSILTFTVLDTTKSDGTFVKNLKLLCKLQNASMFFSKMGLTTLRLPFVFGTNHVRDYIDLWAKSPVFDNQVSGVQQIEQLLTLGKLYANTYLNEWIPMLSGRKTKLSLLDKFGLGYNTRYRTIYDLNHFETIDGQLVPKGKFSQFIRFLEASDKVGRYTQLKLLMQRDGLREDSFNVSRDNIAGLDGFSKRTLRENGVSETLVLSVLTPEQASRWNRAGDEEILNYIDLTQEQYDRIYNAINPADVHALDKQTVIKYARILRQCTTDFSRGSKTSRTINKYFMFFGAALNGLTEYANWIRRSPKRAKVLAFETFMMGMIAQAMGLLMDDDEDTMRYAIRFKIGDIIFKLPVLNEASLAFNAGRVLAKGDNQKVMSFIKNQLWANTGGLFGSPRGLPVIGLGLLQGLTGGNIYKLSDPFEGYTVHTTSDWFKYKNFPSRLVSHNTSTVALLLNRLVPSVSPDTFDYVLNDMIGIGSSLGMTVDSLLTTLSVIGPKQDLYNYIRLQLNPNVEISNTRLGFSEYTFPFVSSASKYMFSNNDRKLKQLYSQYYSDYLDEVGTLDKDPKTPEQESLRNKYLISYSGSQLVNLYYKMISLEPKASNRASLIKEKDKMVQDFMDYFDDNENYSNKLRKYYSNVVDKRRKAIKQLEYNRKAELLGEPIKEDARLAPEKILTGSPFKTEEDL